MRHLWAIATIIAMSSSALAQTAKDQVPDACSLAAFNDYIAAGLALDQSDPLVNSVETIIARRRLTEAFCVRLVQCQNIPALSVAAMVSKCIDDEDEERCDAKQVASRDYGHIRPSRGLTHVTG
jgi:hypothetical protein